MSQESLQQMDQQMATRALMEEMFLHHSNHPNYVLSTSLVSDKNYNRWKRSVEVSLMEKNKLGFVNESCQRPVPTSPLVAQWERGNNMVISWLLHFIEKDIAESVLYCAQNCKSNME